MILNAYIVKKFRLTSAAMVFTLWLIGFLAPSIHSDG